MKNCIKIIALASLALAATGTVRAAENLAGKWKAEFDSPVGLQKYTYEFKVDGDKVTGRAVGVRDEGTNDVQITEGKISKDQITFVEPLKFQDQEIRIEYTGKVSGDEIKFTRKVGDFGSEDFVAKRAKEGAATGEAKGGTNAPATKK